MLGIFLGLFIKSMLRNPSISHLITLLFLWQTEVAAAFAFAAAGIGAAVILHQTQEQQNADQRQRKRTANAIRASLPLVLSELSDYEASCAKSLEILLPPLVTGRVAQQTLHFPSLSVGLVSQITEWIAVSEEAEGEAFVHLLHRLQIQQARLRDMSARALGKNGTMPTNHEVIKAIMAASAIHARCGRLFPFARRAQTLADASISSQQVKDSVFLIGISNAFDPQLEKLIDITPFETVDFP
jgi:hypothetical protein